MVRVSPDDGIALQIGYSSLFIIGGDAIKNFQDLIAIVTLTKERDCEVQSHESVGRLESEDDNLAIERTQGTIK